MRIALIGAGMISETAHLPAILATPGAELAAVVDTVPERAAALLTRRGLKAAVADNLAEVAGQTDAAIIATPNHTHAELAMAGLRAGLPVLVEKPLATNLADAEAVAALASETGLTVAVGFCTRFWRSVQLARELLLHASFGRPLRVVMQYGVAGGWWPVSAYVQDRAQSGGGALVINGSHYLDRLLWWWGPPTTWQYRDDGEGGPEATAVAEFRWDDRDPPVTGCLRVSKLLALPAGTVVETTAGHLIQRDWQAPALAFRPTAAPAAELVSTRPDLDPDQRPDLFVQQLQDFMAAVRDRRPPLVGVADGVAVVRLTAALYAARQPLVEDWHVAASQERPA